jgi:hypothetical protein
MKAKLLAPVRSQPGQPFRYQRPSVPPEFETREPGPEAGKPGLDAAEPGKIGPNTSKTGDYWEK